MMIAKGVVVFPDGEKLEGALAIDSLGVTVNIAGENVVGAIDKNDFFVPHSAYKYIKILPNVG